jgi:hypothetical protein
MFRTEERAAGRSSPRTFDARLTERIVQEFLPLVEQEASAAVLHAVKGDLSRG